MPQKGGGGGTEVIKEGRGLIIKTDFLTGRLLERGRKVMERGA